jgi:hypothetical protein
MVKTFWFNGCKDGERSVSDNAMLCFFGSPLHKARPAGSSFILSSLLLSHMVRCCKEWPRKTAAAQNRAACPVLHCNQRTNINTMHASLSWLKVGERLTATLLFIRNTVLKNPNCLHGQHTHCSDTHTYPTRHATRGLITVPKSRTNARKHTVLYRAMIAWNSLSSQIAQVNSKPGIKRQHFMAQLLSPIWPRYCVCMYWCRLCVMV